MSFRFNDKSTHPVSRRTLLGGTCLWLGAAAGMSSDPAAAAEVTVRAGLVTDIHYADADSRGSRFYRESIGKLTEAAEKLSALRPDLVIELGDLIDSATGVDADGELAFLRKIDGVLKRVSPNRHCVLGNHCLSTVPRDRFLGAVEQASGHRSFDRGGFHFVLLDACHRKDGTPYSAGNFHWTDTEIPAAQQEWLSADLQATRLPTVVFVHQRLDSPAGSPHRIASADAVRKLLQRDGRVRAVFQGHSHQNELNRIEGIDYVTLAAMVEGSGAENSGYSLLEGRSDGSLLLRGFRKHERHPFARAAAG